MKSNETKRRRLAGSASAGVATETEDVPHDDAVSRRLEQRMDLTEANFQREISALKRAGEALLAKNNAIESQLSCLQEENERLKVKVFQLDEENRKLEAAFKIHVENMDWEYDATDPPSDSYWEDQGYVDYEVQFINEDFFRKAKEQSEKLRRGTFGLGSAAEVLQYGDPEYDGLSLIRHDHTMCSHWREFCLAMKTWNFSSVRGTIERTIPYSLSICNIELSANVLNMLRECIKPGGMGYVEELNLTRNNFQGSDGINFAIEIIQSQTKMTEFCYERNPADREQDCQRLFDAIVSHPNIIKCNLNGLFGGETNGHDYLVHLLRKDGIKNINFAGCGVSTNGQSALFDVIKLHPILDELNLENNKLNDRDAIHLADALQRNRTLKELELQMNEFTRLGEETLKKAIYDDSSLNAVANSNHVCEISGLRSWGFLHGVNFRVPYERSRAQKIFRLLEERNKEGTNARHLEGEMRGDTLKILPLTLAAIQIYGEYKAKKVKWQDNGIVWIEDAAPLSITYELLKSWNVPVL